MNDADPQTLPAGTVLGDYRIERTIGHGGFGITYRATDTKLAKPVALKEFLPASVAVRERGEVVPRGARYAEEFAWARTRFLDEARALARFRHPNIVPVLRYFEAHGTALMAMEFEEGPTLAALLSPAGRRLLPADVRRLARALLDGLEAVHAQQFLHRDIKPANIVMRADGVPVLIDFGAARRALGEAARSLTGVLTPQYAPIEQHQIDGAQGPWTDIYAAAAVLHHAILGAPPPEAPSRASADPMEPLERAARGSMDPSFLRAVDAGLAFDATRRPQTIAAWRALFEASTYPETQRMAPPASDTASPASRPSLRGVTRERAAPRPTPRRRVRTALMLAAIGIAPGALFVGYRPLLEFAQAQFGPAPPPAVAPPATPPVPPSPAVDEAARRALGEAAERAAADGRAASAKAEEAAIAARALAGEARIIQARAQRAELENAVRVTTDDGAVYIGQLRDTQRQGLGVITLADGTRRAGEWDEDRLHGLAVERTGDGATHAGRFARDRAQGEGARETVAGERLEGSFADGRFEGPGLRHAPGEPRRTQAGDWRTDQLEGPGVETEAGGERYEGDFRAGRRHGLGVVVTIDGKRIPVRWVEGIRQPDP